MTELVRTVVHCPLCGRIYRQATAHKWGGKTRWVRNDEHALRALCEENGQGKGKEVWVGVAYCTHCSLTRVPDAMKPALAKWLKHGEESCGS